MSEETFGKLIESAKQALAYERGEVSRHHVPGLQYRVSHVGLLYSLS